MSIMNFNDIIEQALIEDLGDGDHTSQATIPENATRKAKLIIKEDGILAGVKIAEQVFVKVDPKTEVKIFITDSSPVKKGDFVFEKSLYESQYEKGISQGLESQTRISKNFERVLKSADFLSLYCF